MKQYIDKAAVVAEIERRKEHYDNIQMIKSGYEDNIEDFNELLSFLDTLEVKEVDLEKEIDKELDRNWYGEYINLDKFRESAKHFFELGIKVQNVE